jgi:hypothetical protein
MSEPSKPSPMWTIGETRPGVLRLTVHTHEASEPTIVEMSQATAGKLAALLANFAQSGRLKAAIE